MDTKEEKRILALIARKEELLKAQTKSGLATAVRGTKAEIAGLKAELQHVRGRDPGKSRS